MAAIVKLVDGLALASVKTYNGLAAASLKTINGQDATSGPVYIVNDTFTEAGSTLLSAHTPDVGGAWSVSGSSTMTIGAGTGTVAVTATLSDSAAINATVPSGANYTMGFIGRIVTTAGANNGITLWGRRTDNNNAYLLDLDFNGNLRLRTRVSGVLTTLGSVYAIPSFSVSTDYTAELVMSGTSISATLNGSTVIGPVTNSDNTIVGTPQMTMTSGSTQCTITQFYIK